MHTWRTKRCWSLTLSVGFTERKGSGFGDCTRLLYRHGHRKIRLGCDKAAGSAKALHTSRCGVDPCGHLNLIRIGIVEEERQLPAVVSLLYLEALPSMYTVRR